MAKFLTITVSGVDYIIPQNGFVAVLQEIDNNTITNINYISANSQDQIKLEHAADTGKIVQDFIKDKFKEMAETNWTNAIIDITADCPIEITGITIG
jgi:hypothetical protein